MAGRAIEQVYPPIATRTRRGGDAVRGLHHPTEFADVGFELRRGEILGFYGLIGAGRSEAMLALMGLKPEARGEHRRGRASARHPPARPTPSPQAWPTCPRSASARAAS
jgi:ABC-type sugar transport system ATPase subunit